MPHGDFHIEESVRGTGTIFNSRDSSRCGNSKIPGLSHRNRENPSDAPTGLAQMFFSLLIAIRLLEA